MKARRTIEIDSVEINAVGIRRIVGPDGKPMEQIEVIYTRKSKGKPYGSERFIPDVQGTKEYKAFMKKLEELAEEHEVDLGK